ncbi:hypothetical protein CG396_04095 [Bifidobacteriaceae bacterium N170]|nr:hypothetical protein CG396_04095 [Bifidobacteriaceae bacterium N170]
MGSLKVLDGEWEKRFEGPLRETQQSASISPHDDYLQTSILHIARTTTRTTTLYNCGLQRSLSKTNAAARN